MKLDHVLSPYTKINSKCMRDLNVRQDSIKILEENTGHTLFELGHSNFLQDTSTKAKETKAKVNYWDFIKIRSFCTAKDTVNKTKRQPTEWEKIFANDISDKELVSKIYKELIKLNTKETNNSIMKWAKDMNRNSLLSCSHLRVRRAALQGRGQQASVSTSRGSAWRFACGSWPRVPAPGGGICQPPFARATQRCALGMLCEPQGAPWTAPPESH